MNVLRVFEIANDAVLEGRIDDASSILTELVDFRDLGSNHIWRNANGDRFETQLHNKHEWNRISAAEKLGASPAQLDHLLRRRAVTGRPPYASTQTLVYRPGATGVEAPGGNVFTTWPALETHLQRPGQLAHDHLYEAISIGRWVKPPFTARQRAQRRKKKRGW